MIILDLEWNRGYDKTPLDEILQIGAVRLERLGGPILDTFDVYIRPAVHKKFDFGAKNLPELQASRSSELDFPAAMALFRAWCGEERVYGAWGGGDLAILDASCAYWKVPAPTMEKVLDLQTAFAYLVGTGQQIALWRAAAYCQIPDTFTFHNALNDALYTAILGGWLTREALDYVPVRAPRRRRPSLKLSPLPFSRPPRQTLGPFPSAAGALDSKKCRRPPCPICGAKGCVHQWCSAHPSEEGGPRQYLSLFSCPEHGRFLCRLTLIPLEDGTWRGRRTVPVITPELIQEYTAACQGSVHTCRGRRRRTSRRQRPQKEQS